MFDDARRKERQCPYDDQRYVRHLPRKRENSRRVYGAHQQPLARILIPIIEEMYKSRALKIPSVAFTFYAMVSPHIKKIILALCQKLHNRLLPFYTNDIIMSHSYRLNEIGE